MWPDTAKGSGNGLGDIGAILMYAELLHLGQSNIIKATKAMKQQNKIRPPNEKHERPTEMFRPELSMQRTKCRLSWGHPQPHLIEFLLWLKFLAYVVPFLWFRVAASWHVL